MAGSIGLSTRSFASLSPFRVLSTGMVLFVLCGIAYSIKLFLAFEKVNGPAIGITATQHALNPASDNLFYPGGETDAFFGRTTSATQALTVDTIKGLGGSMALVSTKPEFFVCTAPKTGCTAWKYFWNYINTGQRWNTSIIEKDPGIIYRETVKKSRDNGGVVARWYHNRSKSDILSMGAQLNKVVIGRNPYVRFLSSYKDWLHRVKKNETQVSFDNFTQTVYKAKNGDASSKHLLTGGPLDHIFPISNYCQLTMISYTLLRVEEQALWYNQFLVKYHLKEKMDEYTGHGNLVFLSGLYKEALVKDFTAQISGREPWPSALFQSSHHRGSSKLLAEYYTPATAKQVTEIVFDDLVNFGYPLWDGVVENFRMV